MFIFSILDLKNNTKKTTERKITVLWLQVTDNKKEYTIPIPNEFTANPNGIMLLQQFP